ncbi:MAG: hypothetical protein ACU0BF_09630 [Paracoccaceae bacterium]
MVETDAPRALVLGDSHAAAISRGLDLLGIPNALIWTAGRTWDEGGVREGGRHGVEIGWGRAAQARLADAARRLGGDLTTPGVPVIGSFAHHLGRMRAQMRVGHCYVSAEPRPAAEAANAYSQGYLADAAVARRAPLIALAGRIARSTPLVMVRQPKVAANDTPWHDVVDAALESALGEVGVTVFDHRPWAVDPATGHVPAHLLEEDGGHGTAEYGRICAEAMIAGGLLTV